MFSHLVKAVLLTLVLCSTLVVSASGGGEESAEEGGHGGGGEGGAAKPAVKDEYAEAQSQAAALQAKVRSSEETIKRLIEEKQKAQTPAQVAEVVKNLVNEHKNFKQQAEEYERARAYLQYRFPEKGMKGERRYERVEVKSLEDLEKEVTLDARLKRTMHKVRQQYEKPNEQKKPAAESNSSKRNKKNRTQEAPSVAEPVIISK